MGQGKDPPEIGLKPFETRWDRLHRIIKTTHSLVKRTRIEGVLLRNRSDEKKVTMKYRNSKLTALAAAILFSIGSMFTGHALARSQSERETVSNDIRKALVTLPFLSVFDNLTYSMVGDTVVLDGQVTRPSLKRDAASSVQRVKGVSTVVNNIEVLPLSSFDDRIRREAYRRIYGAAPLNKYTLNPIPPIRIIVNRGHLTLEGVVDNRNDFDIANIQAHQVANVFAVTNNLLILKETM